MKKLADLLIAHAMKSPYVHLKGYMDRYWVVPYLRQGSVGAEGCGPVCWYKRPFTRVLQSLGIAARVHNILRSDDDRAYHDHPWPYLTIILRGGYWEVTPRYQGDKVVGDHRVWYGPGSFLFRKASSWHRLEVTRGQTAWTLFITGRYQQGWGFMEEPGNKIPYKDYLALETPYSDYLATEPEQ